MDFNEYSEHNKQAKVLDAAQTIGEFLDYSGYVLAQYKEIEGFRDPQLVPVTTSISRVLAEYFDIDLNKIEQEKRQMLESLRT